MILDLLDKTEDLLAFQRVCNEWKEVLLSYVMDGRLKSRALVSMLFLFFALATWFGTLWFQLEDMFQLIVTPQGIEKVTIQLIDTPTKVYAIGARLFLSRVPLEVLQT